MMRVVNLKLLLLTMCGCMAISTLCAQDIVHDPIYESVSNYREQKYGSNYGGSHSVSYSSYSEPSLLYRNSLQVGIAAPAFISYIIHGLYDLSDSNVSAPNNLSNNLAQARYYRSAEFWWPCLSAEYQHTVLDWLSLGVKSVFGWRTQATRSVTDNKVLYRDYMLTSQLLFQMRFSWLHRDHISMYSSVGVGVLSSFENDVFLSMLPAIDLVYVGMSFGGKLYGFWELGALGGGSLRGGIGVRF